MMWYDAFMSGSEIDSNIRWFNSVMRKLGFSADVEVRVRDSVQDAKSWLKEPVKGIQTTEAEKILAMYEAMLLNSPGNASILEKIRKHRNKYGLWD